MWNLTLKLYKKTTQKLNIGTVINISMFKIVLLEMKKTGHIAFFVKVFSLKVHIDDIIFSGNQ